MIHHSLHNEDKPKQIVGIQRFNRDYTCLHWRDQGSTGKFKYLDYSTLLDPRRYKPIGPTLLVEWTDD